MPPETEHKVKRIKDGILACRKILEVNETAKHFQIEVEWLTKQGGDERTMAIQIKNLAAYQRMCIANGWVK